MTDFVLTVQDSDGSNISLYGGDYVAVQRKGMTEPLAVRIDTIRYCKTIFQGIPDEGRAEYFSVDDIISAKVNGQWIKVSAPKQPQSGRAA